MEKKVIKRNDWVSNFTLIGKPVINDYTFKLDEKSEKSNWVYNALNLGVDCGEKYGTVYAEMMGGYSEENENRIYAHGKKDDGSDNFDEQIVVAWEDRFNEGVLEDIGDMSFLTVGLVKTNSDKTFYNKFLSAYDAIAYIKKHLTSDMVISVRGNLKYSEYNGNVQVRKNITSIALSKAEDSSMYKATFTQSVLLDKDSASLKEIDKDKGVMFVDARVLDYVKEVNGIEVKGQYPFKKKFEFAMDFSNEAQCKKIYEKLFKVKKDVTQVTFEGDFVEGGAVVTTTIDDLPDEIRDLVEAGIYTEEEACAKCTANGNRERRMVLRKPAIKLVGEDKTPVLQKFDGRFTEDDLYLDYLYKNNKSDNEEEEESGSDNSMDWLNSL
jgi:glutaredoxin 2